MRASTVHAWRHYCWFPCTVTQTSAFHDHCCCSARPADPPSERRAPLSQFQLLPCGADDKDALALAADVQAMLGAVQREAAAIESTAGATPAGGWGDLALPLVVAPAEQLKQLAAQQRSAGGRRSPSPVAGRPLPPPPLPAQLLECRRCHKVLMACAALQHQRQCSQVPEATVAQPGGEASLSQSDGRSSSDGVPAPAPSASRGSKRKRPSGSAAAAAGGAKASRMSKGGSMRAGSVELTPSLGEGFTEWPVCMRMRAWATCNSFQTQLQLRHFCLLLAA